MKIEKSKGITPTEQRLSDLCERTFLKLWSWPNLYKDDGKELSDVLAVFGDHMLVFFDRASQALQDEDKDLEVTWPRWKKEVIDKQIKTANGAERYLKSGRPIYLDERKQTLWPITVPKNPIIHKIIVAHGAEEVCLASSTKNVTGSLAIAYTDLQAGPRFPFETPFLVELDKTRPVHVLDGPTLDLLLTELDTFADFAAYLTEKEATIRKRDTLAYCGEEDLLGRYFGNYDERQQRYHIDTTTPDVDMLWVPEGTWKVFTKLGRAARRRQANAQSYLWDSLIQKCYQHILDGTIQGDSPWVKDNPLTEMASEPRLARRHLSRQIIEASNAFSAPTENVAYKVRYMRSFMDPEKLYVFLQVHWPDATDVRNRPTRTHFLMVACGVARNHISGIKTVVGIAVDPPKYVRQVTEDFLLFRCAEWGEEDRAYFERENEILNFFQNVRHFEERVVDFE